MGIAGSKNKDIANKTRKFPIMDNPNNIAVLHCDAQRQVENAGDPTNNVMPPVEQTEGTGEGWAIGNHPKYIRKSNGLSQRLPNLHSVENKPYIGRRTVLQGISKTRHESSDFSGTYDRPTGEGMYVRSDNKFLLKYYNRHRKVNTESLFPTVNVSPRLAPLENEKRSYEGGQIKKELKKVGILSRNENEDPDFVLKELRQMGLVKNVSLSDGQLGDVTFEIEDEKQYVGRLPPLGVDSKTTKENESLQEKCQLLEGGRQSPIKQNGDIIQNEITSVQEVHENEKNAKLKRAISH